MKKIAPTPRPRRHWRDYWEALIIDAAKTAHLKMMRDMARLPQYLYYVPANETPGAWGSFHVCDERDTAPAHAQLVSPQRIPPGTSMDVHRWINKVAVNLPMLGDDAHIPQEARP